MLSRSLGVKGQVKCEFSRDGITKYDKLGGLKNRNLILTVLEARCPRSKCWQGCVFLKASFLGL